MICVAYYFNSTYKVLVKTTYNGIVEVCGSIPHGSTI